MSFLRAALYDRMMKAVEDACLASWRADLLAPLSGAVLEIGAGTGANLAHYPDTIARLVLAEPDPVMRHRLSARAVAQGREVIGADAESLPFADGAFDFVVSTLVLCSVQDPAAALAEMRRVLKPGGRLVFIEHVAATDNPGRLRWQKLLEPIWRPLMGNCHLTRRTAEAIRAAGFALDEVKRESVRKTIPIARPSVRGTAVR